MKKRKIKFSRLLILLFAAIVIIFLLSLLFVNYSFVGKKSIHEDARKYSNKSCLIFYPDSKKGESVAKQICKENKEEKIYDYVLVPFGDYYLVDYGNGYSYYTDKDFNEIEFTSMSKKGESVVSDYLRYTVKKEYPEKYTLEFLEKSYVDNLDLSNATYELEKESLKCYIPEFDITVYIPLKDIQNEIHMNFGYPKSQYVKPSYVDQSKPKICLTFHGGPNFVDDEVNSTGKIVETLYKYDVVGTFFVIGDNLEDYYWLDEDINAFLKKSIRQGNEYGSNQQTGDTYLTELSDAGILEAIEGPMKYFKKYLNYEMKLYRPIGMDRDERVDTVSPYTAILWNVNSNDDILTNPDDIYDRVINQMDIDEGDIICFNDTYDETAVAIEKIVPELIRQGYQIVTVTDLINSLNVSKINYIFDSTYFD